MSTSVLSELLRANPYPGRGILMGRSSDGEHAVLAYFIMGRSENSRNRVFASIPDGIRTQVHDPAKCSDPALILYNPVRRFGRTTIVSNGDQTDTIREGLAAGRSFIESLRTRTFEPDAPNYTPRISGLLEPDGRYALSILSCVGGNPAACCRSFFEYDQPLAGQGHLIHTYQGNGDPLPSFTGSPVQVGLSERTAKELADTIWESLNEEHKISLFVRYISLKDDSDQTRVINKYGESWSLSTSPAVPILDREVPVR